MLFFLTAPLLFANIDVIEIRILPESVVYNSQYTLGDIAELDGFDVDAIQELAKIGIGMSPIAGHSHYISQRQIESKIKNRFPRHQLNITVPPKSMVSRASVKISAEQIQQIIEGEIRKQYSTYDEVKITIKTRLKDVFLPKGKASYDIANIAKTGLIGGYSTWVLNLKLDEKPVKKLMIRAKVQVYGDVQVASNQIQKGTLVGAEDVKTVKKDISKERIGYMAEPEVIVGQQARRDIFKNEAIKDHLVEAPVILQKGDPVKVVYQTKNLKLTNLATAMRSGRKGDVIPVRTLNGKTTIYAVVIDSNSVEIAL